jgi:hypothetical protein
VAHGRIFLPVHKGQILILKVGHRPGRRLRYCILVRIILIFEVSICLILKGIEFCEYRYDWYCKE